MTDPKQTVDVKDLISRYRQGSSGLKRESESTNRNIEPSGSKNARKEKEKAWETNAESGEYILRAAQTNHTTDPLGFLKRIRREKYPDEPERDELMAIIRGAHLSESDDIDRAKQRHATRAMVQKFERGDSNEEYHIHEHELVSPVHIQTSMLSCPATNSHSQQNGHTQLEDSLQSPQEEQDYTDFDLSEIQGSGQLDIGFNKQKLLLVQKGSIANRRKPSRTSVRTASDASNGTEHIDSVVVGDKGEMGNVNGHSEVLEEEAPSSPPPIPSSSPPTSPPRSPRGQGPVLRTGKQIVGVKTAIVLPGLADLGKTKLKSVTSPESKESATPEKRSTDKEESPFWLTNLQKNPRVIPPTLSPGSPEKEKEETPSWLVKLQKKPKVLPPSFSSEKSPAEKEAEETPSWVANHPKKPRALPRSLNPGKAASEQKKDDTPSWLANLQRKPRVLPPSGSPEKKPVEQEEPEWVKQALSKKHKVPIPVPKEPEKKDSEPTVAPWMKERMNRRSLVSPLQAINTTNVSSTSVLTDFSPKDISDSASVSPEDTMEEQECSNEGDSSLSSSPQRKDLLTPLSHKLSVEHGEPMDQDENSPPSHSSVSSLPPRSVLPPLDKTPSTKSLSETDEENVPAWKKEIAERRKSKVFIPTQRPEKPLTLGEIPQWKKELAEKSKHRKDTFDRTPDVTPSKESFTESVSPWQQEMAQKKMRPISKALEPKEKARTEDPVPEWMKQVQQRRQRLAESGLIKKQSHGQSNT